MLMKGDKDQIRSKYGAEIAKFKEHLRQVAKKEEKVVVAPVKVLASLNIPPVARLPKADENTSEQSWYRQYSYFYFGQKLPIT